MPLHYEGEYRQPYREHIERSQHRMAEQAHHPEVQFTGVQENLSIAGMPELGHLDETAYEHDHVDFESRFHEYQVPHHEVGHDAHGIQEEWQVDDNQDYTGNPDKMQYDELLWGYQHGDQDHIDHHSLHSGQEVVHHEDIAYFEAPFHAEHGDAGYELPLFEPHHAEYEHIMEHGYDHPDHYESDGTSYRRGDLEAHYDEERGLDRFHNDDPRYNEDVDVH